MITFNLMSVPAVPLRSEEKTMIYVNLEDTTMRANDGNRQNKIRPTQRKRNQIEEIPFTADFISRTQKIVGIVRARSK